MRIRRPTSRTGDSNVFAVGECRVDDIGEVVFVLLQQRGVVGVLDVVQSIVKIFVRNVAECVVGCDRR